MSKTKKLATAIVSIVLASSMCFAFAACNDDNGGDTPPSPGPDPTPGGELEQSQDLLDVSTDANGDLSWAEGTSLLMNMGQSGTISLAYSEDNIASSATVTSLDGKQYNQGTLKPAWRALSEKLGIAMVDDYDDNGGSNGDRILNAVSTNTLGNWAMISGNSADIVTYGSGNNMFLDLSLYLDYMPNFRYFLENNPVTYMSLTSQTDTGAIYYAPYFDGNDDIEKYAIARKDWVEALLDSEANAGSTTATFASQASAKSSAQAAATVSTQASVSSFMGTEGSWNIESSNPEDEGLTTVTVTVSYDAVLDALQNSSSALATAVSATGVTPSSITSGNIVDIQNAAINSTNGAVTGQQLLNILKAYIDVAYSVEGEAYAQRSDVFNGYNAAWDVDLLVAFMRCVSTNTNLLPDMNLRTNSQLVYGLQARQGNMQRQSDIIALAGELYGVRGLVSRYEYTYIDSNGAIQDARLDTATYDAMDKMNDMAKEGLLYTNRSQSANNNSFYTNATTPVTFMEWDYVQTQTANGGFVEQDVAAANANIPDGYDFAPINTPVSKWNDGDTSTAANEDGISYSYDGDYKYMRFTESWRSVKNTGFAIPYAYVQNSPDRLAACLAIIDYMFSNDGQILMTYGEISSNGNTCTPDGDGTYTANDNGWWYGNEQTDVDIDDVAFKPEGSDQYYIDPDYANRYFVYEGKVYTGTYYKGQMQPTMTTASLMLFYGYEINGMQIGTTATSTNPAGGWGGRLSYTNYARIVIGSAQPMGNKLQSFEYQCTAQCGLDGADLVAAGLVNGTISHVYTDPDNDKGMWYFIVPTTLPYDSNVANSISMLTTNLRDIYSNESGATSNYLWDILKFGYGATSLPSGAFTYGNVTIACPANATAAVGNVSSTHNMATFEVLMQVAFEDIMTYYNTYIVG